MKKIREISKIFYENLLTNQLLYVIIMISNRKDRESGMVNDMNINEDIKKEKNYLSQVLTRDPDKSERKQVETAIAKFKQAMINTTMGIAITYEGQVKPYELETIIEHCHRVRRSIKYSDHVGKVTLSELRAEIDECFKSVRHICDAFMKGE